MFLILCTFVLAVTLYKARGHRVGDRLVVGFTTIPVQSVPTTTKIVSSNPAQGDATLCDKVCR